MKPLVIVFSLAFAFTTAFGQSFEMKETPFALVSSSEIAVEWETQSKDAGIIEIGEEVTLNYSFVNKGKEAIRIERVKPSCGCTGVDYSKTLIAPGEKAFVSASYKGKSAGHFNKTVSVFFVNGSSPTLLRFKGEVEASKGLK
ncbi:MAG: DUF1573 domain-containing protein [Bacteroidia bacterium]|nr:DUF1573 domain-containing protein [Bacteroidia bacterium]